MNRRVPEVIYTSQSELRSLRSLARNIWRDLKASRELAWRLMVRDISAQYRQSLLGVLWVFAEIRQRHPATRILVLTIHRAEEYVHASLRSGANGYVLKDASHDELRVAIRSVLDGKTYLSPDVSASVVNGFLGKGPEAASSPWSLLTHREREVLKLVAEGHSNRGIAQFLCLSVKTVEKHRSNVMRKLDLHNAATLTAYAIERGLVVSRKT